MQTEYTQRVLNFHLTQDGDCPERQAQTTWEAGGQHPKSKRSWPKQVNGHGLVDGFVLEDGQLITKFRPLYGHWLVCPEMGVKSEDLGNRRFSVGYPTLTHDGHIHSWPIWKLTMPFGVHLDSQVLANLSVRSCEATPKLWNWPKHSRREARQWDEHPDLGWLITTTWIHVTLWICGKPIINHNNIYNKPLLEMLLLLDFTTLFLTDYGDYWGCELSGMVSYVSSSRF